MAKYDIKKSSAFKRAIKKFENQKKVLEKIEIIIDTLADDIPLEPKHKDHALRGEYIGYRECHIEPDLLLIYKKQEDILVLVCFRLGSHSELF